MECSTEYNMMSLYKNELNTHFRNNIRISSLNKIPTLEYDRGVPYSINNNTVIIYIDKELVGSVWSDKQLPYVSLTPAISEIIDKCEENDNVKNYIFMIDSGGGDASGISNLARKIKQIQKPTICYTTDICASAAYWLASSCDKIIAGSETAAFGSIGAYIYMCLDNDDYFISNRASPDKIPDPRTEEGKSVLQNRLDDVYDIFVTDVATNRNTTVGIVKETFGKGSVLVAKKALSCGMIDEIDLSFSINSKDKASFNNDVAARYIGENIKSLLERSSI